MIKTKPQPTWESLLDSISEFREYFELMTEYEKSILVDEVIKQLREIVGLAND